MVRLGGDPGRAKFYHSRESDEIFFSVIIPTYNRADLVEQTPDDPRCAGPGKCMADFVKMPPRPFQNVIHSRTAVKLLI